MSGTPVTEYPTPVLGPTGQGVQGVQFPADGSGLPFNAGYPITFAPQVGDLASLFPTYRPEVERIVYQTLKEACNSRTIFPVDGQGIQLPATFSIPPTISLFVGRDGSYTIPVGPNAGKPVPSIPVLRGWPTIDGQIPSIGVAESTSTEIPDERGLSGGFVKDSFAYDQYGNLLASCAYYAEPLRTTVVVELIHTNRDERDRLDDQLWRVLLPLRRQLGVQSPLVRDVQISSEKQDVPVDEQPIVMYVSVFTLEVEAEVLVPTEIMPTAAGGVITQITADVTALS